MKSVMLLLASDLDMARCIVLFLPSMTSQKAKRMICGFLEGGA